MGYDLWRRLRGLHPAACTCVNCQKGWTINRLGQRQDFLDLLGGHGMTALALHRLYLEPPAGQHVHLQGRNPTTSRPAYSAAFCLEQRPA